MFDHIEMFQEIGLDFNFESQKYIAVWYCHSVSNFWLELLGTVTRVAYFQYVFICDVVDIF